MAGLTRPGRLALGAAGVLLVAAAIFAWRRGQQSAVPEALVRQPPLPRRVEVEVLNGGGRSGAAREAAIRLRHGRLDVVLIENAPLALRDTTRRHPLVLVRRGDTTGVGRIRELYDSIEVRDAPDPRPLVDLTVVIGRGEPGVEPKRSVDNP